MFFAWISSECPMLNPIDVASASSPAKRLWVQKVPAQHHCHFVLCCLCHVLAQLGWRLHPLGSWFLQLSWVGVCISTDTMNPRNVHFLLLRTLRLPFVCYVSFCHSNHTQTRSYLALIGWLFLWKTHLRHARNCALTPKRKEVTHMEVVFNLRDLDRFTADGLLVNSSNCVLRIGCWWFKLCTTDCELWC